MESWVCLHLPETWITSLWRLILWLLSKLLQSNYLFIYCFSTHYWKFNQPNPFMGIWNSNPINKFRNHKPYPASENANKLKIVAFTSSLNLISRWNWNYHKMEISTGKHRGLLPLSRKNIHAETILPQKASNLSPKARSSAVESGFPNTSITA